MESDESDLLSNKSGQGDARIALPCRKSKPSRNELEPGCQVGLFFNWYNIEGHRINGNWRPFRSSVWETIGIQVTNPRNGKGIRDVTSHPQLGAEVHMHMNSVPRFEFSNL